MVRWPFRVLSRIGSFSYFASCHVGTFGDFWSRLDILDLLSRNLSKLIKSMFVIYIA